MRLARCLPPIVFGLLATLDLPRQALAAGALRPLAEEGIDALRPMRFSDRTLSLLVEVDRDQARLVAFTGKDRPFVRPESPAAPRPYLSGGGVVQLELVLLGPGGVSHVERVEVGPLCLDHEASAPPHIEGDTILLHRDTVVVELPQVDGFDQVELARYEGDAIPPERRPLGFEHLDAARFTAAGSNAIATSGAVHWPEEYGDPDVYTVYGNEAETSQRINLVIVPDGYRHVDKARMQTDAQSLVSSFRQKTPYKEHDAFFNYILVYAYSTQSGTDQCDCSIVKDTAMNTRFPQLGSPPYDCGDVRNRCLYYGTLNGGPDCDQTVSEVNLGLAELRAPAADKTVVMVNTGRYGGCGGARAVYAAGDATAAEIAVHELGHSLGGLDDEYGGGGCGSFEAINVSSDASDGSWPEWRADLGAPTEGAHYRDSCIYRPSVNCDMRSLEQPFCAVCNQRWALVYFGHSRVRPTAPIASRSPASPAAAEVGAPADFSVATRLAAGAGVTNSFTWKLQGPGYPSPTTVATGSPSLSQLFTQTGTYTLTCEVVADTNFIKGVKNDGNVDTVAWTVNVAPSSCDARPLFAGLADAVDLEPCAATGIRLTWAPATFGPDGGNYDVWRDGTRIQRGVATSPYVDLPGDSAPHTYRVRAVSADCGLEDANVADRTAADGAGDPPPAFAGIATASDAEACAASGIAATWTAATFGPAGGTYELYRDGVAIATGLTATFATDLPGDTLAHAYRMAARSLDCGIETAPATAIDAADLAGDPPPLFAGIGAAGDLDACFASGIQLSWEPATLGPSGGLYQVWRDGAPLATVSALAYVDVPGDAQAHAYRVLAVSGDCNRDDGNGRTIDASDAAIDPASLPASAGNTLFARRVGRSLVLEWAAVATAVSYNAYRGDVAGTWPGTPDASGLIATTVSFADVDAPPSLRCYRVSASNCAGREGP